MHPDQKRNAAARTMTRDDDELAALLARRRELTKTYRPEWPEFSDFTEIVTAAKVDLRRQVQNLESLLGETACR